METSTIVIKHYYTGKVLFAHTCEGNTQRVTVERAVSQDVSLRYADLSGFDLSNANLFGADLQCTLLRGANLWGADMRDTDCRHVSFGGYAIWIVSDAGRLRRYGRFKTPVSDANLAEMMAVCPSYRVRPSDQTTVDSYPTLF